MIVVDFRVMNTNNDDPITGIGVVASPGQTPQGYQPISSTVDGKDADIWKDSLFSKTVRRYICFTRTFPLDNGRWRNVVKDIKVDRVSSISILMFFPRLSSSVLAIMQCVYLVFYRTLNPVDQDMLLCLIQ